MGGTSKDTLQQVNLLAKGLVISGAGAQESASTIRQWSQAMASGLLRGDEFNSIMENSPRIAKALSDALHVNIGVLRQMAEAGELSADKVAKALASQAKAINDEYEKMPVSVGVAFEKIKAAFGQYVAEADKSVGATHGIAGSMEQLAYNIKPVLDTLITAGKIAAVIFTGAAITGISAYTAAQWQAVQSARAQAAMLAAHSQALRMDLQRTAQLTAARVAQIQADIAATQATLAGTLSMGQRMAMTNALNIQTGQLTAATLAQTEANAALAASTGTWGAALKALPFAALNGAMALTVGYMIGDWLNSFSIVRKGAAIAIDAIISAFEELIYTVKSYGLQWQLVFTWDEGKRAALKQALADLDQSFANGIAARKEVLDSTLDYEDSTKQAKTATDELIDSVLNTKTPLETFKEKSAALTKELNDGKLSAEAYTKVLLSLHDALNADLAKLQTPFDKEKAKLEDKAYAQSHTPEQTQRRDYLKTHTVEETDALMALWVTTKDGQQQVAQDAKQHAKSVLDVQLATLTAQQDALKSTHELELSRTKNNTQAKQLALKQLLDSQQISEQTYRDRSLALDKAQFADELALKKAYLVNAAQLAQAELDTKVKNAPQGAKFAVSTPEQEAQFDKILADNGGNLPKAQATFQQQYGGGTDLNPQKIAADKLAIEQDLQAKLAALEQDAQSRHLAFAATELTNAKARAAQLDALALQAANAKHDDALAALDDKVTAAQQELDLGNITNQQYLDQLRTFAADRLGIEQQLLADKKALLKNDELALKQNLMPMVH